jgi:hypothetical protein
MVYIGFNTLLSQLDSSPFQGDGAYYYSGYLSQYPFLISTLGYSEMGFSNKLGKTMETTNILMAYHNFPYEDSHGLGFIPHFETHPNIMCIMWVIHPIISPSISHDLYTREDPTARVGQAAAVSLDKVPSKILVI